MKKFGIWFLLLAVVACSSDGDKSDKTAAKPEKAAKSKQETDPIRNLICPQVAILREAQEMKDYGAEKPDPSQLVARARMRSVEGDCGYVKDEKDKTKTGIDIAFTVHMVAEKGTRLGGSQTSFPYFIAVVDPAENILSRQTLTAHFVFSGSGTVASDDEPLHVFIPLSEQAMMAGPDYRVLVGFRGARN